MSFVDMCQRKNSGVNRNEAYVIENKKDKKTPQVRLSVAVERELVEELERLHRENGYAPNRSEVVGVALQALKEQRIGGDQDKPTGLELDSAIRMLLRLYQIQPQTAREFITQLSSQITLEESRLPHGISKSDSNKQGKRRSA